MKKPTFDKNELNVCLVGKTRIDVDTLGRPVFFKRGRMKKHFWAAAEYVAAHKPLADALADWLSWRNEVAAKWKHDTQHFRYDCDGGALAVRLNGNTVIHIGNGVGDGNYPVYFNPSGPLPPTFKPTGLSIDGPCAIEPLNYDCTGGEPIVSYNLHNGESMWVYRDGEGAIVLKKH